MHPSIDRARDAVRAGQIEIGPSHHRRQAHDRSIDSPKANVDVCKPPRYRCSDATLLLKSRRRLGCASPRLRPAAAPPVSQRLPIRQRRANQPPAPAPPQLPGISVAAPLSVQVRRRPKARVVTDTVASATPPPAADRAADSCRARTRSSTRPARTSSRRSAPPPIRSTTRPSKRCRRATTRRWTRCCCSSPASRRTRPRAANCMCATSTPTCNIASTASCCPTASARSARSSTPASSAAWRC